MKSFLAIFTCAENSENHEKWKKLTREEKQERERKGLAAHEAWTKKHQAQIIYEGGPLDEVTKLVDNHGIHDIPSQMGAFMVVQANSHDEAAKIFVGHPHFTFFPGDGVIIVERAQREYESSLD